MTHSGVMKIIALIPLLLYLFFSSFAFAAEFESGGYLRATYSVDTYYEDVWGNRGLSNLDVDPETGDNFHYAENLRLSFRRLLGRDLTLEGSFWGRHTTDKLLQRLPGDRWMINDMRLRLTGDTFEVGLGDLSAYFSNYTFNNTLFGVTASLRPSKNVTLSVLAGTNRDGERDTFEHLFYGARVETRPIRQLDLALTYVHTEITKLYPGTSMTDYADDVLSFSSRLSLMDGRLVLSGEGAGSLYTADRRSHSSDSAWGGAVWAALSFSPLRNELEFLLAYEYVDPGFLSVMGTYSTDRETISAGVRYTPSDILSLTAYFRSYHNRLSERSAAPYRTDTIDPGMVVTIKPFVYDGGSSLQSLTVELATYWTGERSDDPLLSVADDRLFTHVRVSDAWGPLNVALYCDVEWDDDRTSTDTDTLVNTFGAQAWYWWTGARLSVSADCLLEMKIEDIRPPHDPHLLDTAARIGGGVTVVLDPTAPYPARGSVRYEGIFSDRELAADTWENNVEIHIEKVVMKSGGLTGSLGLSYRIHDVASPTPGESYGEEVYGLFVRLEF